MISLDGSFGEGGGQILRTALALSACTGRPFEIVNIRAGRKKPGLMRQHLTCVDAARQICSAAVEGAEINSQRLRFTPGRIKSGEFQFSVGTAGSTMLVLQTVLPPLILAEKPSIIELQGGTHNPMAPTFHYIDEIFLPLISKHFAQCHGKLESWGFFPAGGGKAVFHLNPISPQPRPLDLCDRGKFIRAEVKACVAKIERQIAVDECKAMVNSSRFPIEASVPVSVDSVGPGNLAWAKLEFENCSAMFTGFGEHGVSRQKVAANVFQPANHFFASEAAIDEHLADQIALIMALGGGGCYTSTRPTMHTTTNLKVIEQFLEVETKIESLDSKCWKISIIS